jgi:hypothetical protein
MRECAKALTVWVLPQQQGPRLLQGVLCMTFLVIRHFVTAKTVWMRQEAARIAWPVTFS